MKPTAVVILILLCVWTAAHAADAAAKKVLLPFYNDAYGAMWYVDATGARPSNKAYDRVEEFHEGLAAVERNGLYGYIDANELFVVTPRFPGAKRFSGGLAAVQADKDGLWGYIDAKGSFVVPPRFKSADPFQEGFAHVWTGEETLLIDRTGRALAVPSPWKVSGEFSEGLAAVRTEGAEAKAGFIDPTGRIALVLPSCSWAEGFRDGLSRVKAGEKYGYADKSGKIVIPAVYEDEHAFHEKRAAVSIGGKWGFIDLQGRTVVAAEYDHALDFRQGLAPVGRGGGGFGSVGAWGYIDAAGKTVIPAAYSTAYPFRDGIARVAIGESIFEERFFYIDGKGRPLPKLPGFLVEAKTDFSTEAGDTGFTTAGPWKTEKGVYSYAGKGEGGETVWTARLVPPDFYAEVKVVSLSGKNPAAGIAFRVDEKAETFYWFGLRKDGSCMALYSAGDGKWEPLDEGRVKAKAGANTLQVACRGDTAYCFLNGAKALTFRDTRIGPSYRHIGFYVETATAVSFDDLAVRAIGRDEGVAGLELEPTMEDLCARMDTQLSAFPDSALRVFVPRDPKSPEELYLAFGGLGTGAYLMKPTGGTPDPLEFSFVGQPLFKDLGKYLLQFPFKMPPLKAGVIGLYDESTAYSPRIYHPLLAAPGTMDLAVFLRDWRALSLDWETTERRIESENRWILGEDPFGIVMDVVGIGGILATLWGLIDWGISGTFGERQSWEVWGGLGALGSYYAVYMPIGYLIIKPIYESIAKGKVEEERRKYDERFRARAAAMRAKHPEDVIEGRPWGAEGR